VLPINLFNQQIFTAIWFWYIIVLLWNICEMIVWAQRSLPSRACKWIQRRVSLINQSIKVRQNRLNHFLDHYLEADGIFMIRMIANNTSDYVATDLIHNLWCKHAENYDQLFPNDPHNLPDVPCVFEHRKKPNKQQQQQAHVEECDSCDAEEVKHSTLHKQPPSQIHPTTYLTGNPSDVYNKLISGSTDSITFKNRAPSFAHQNVMHRLQGRPVVESENEEEDGPVSKFKPSQTKV
jgi:hypothetical protein